MFCFDFGCGNLSQHGCILFTNPPFLIDDCPIQNVNLVRGCPSQPHLMTPEAISHSYHSYPIKPPFIPYLSHIYHRIWQNDVEPLSWEPKPCRVVGKVSPEQLVKYVTTLKPKAISEDGVACHPRDGKIADIDLI